MARCPAHDDHDPSLSIREGEDGKTLVHCFAGCDQQHVIAALQERGLWDRSGQLQSGHIPPPRRAPNDHSDRDVVKQKENAMRIWDQASPAAGTLVETYFKSRGILIPPPPSIRFHPGLKHPSRGLRPAMVALVTRGADAAPMAIHRTFLTTDGSGKAPVDRPKMMLGPCGGGVVRLAVATEFLMIGEGIETCLSVMQATKKPVWAALSTSGLRGLNLPAEVRDVTVLADGDDSGEAAARVAAMRWRREGRRVRIARPPRGLDFNDVLLGRWPCGTE